MTVPQVSIEEIQKNGVEAILRRFDHADTSERYTLPNWNDFRQLSEAVAKEGDFVSLYLALTPDRRLGKSWQTALNSLRRTSLPPVSDKELRGQVETTLSRIEMALSGSIFAPGRGVAFFVCPSLGIWRQFILPLALPDMLRAGEKAYILPLVRMKDEHDRYAVALLSREKSRFFVGQTGVLQEVLEVRGEKLRGFFTDRVPQEIREDVEEKILADEGKALARVITAIYRQFGAKHFLLSAPQKLKPHVERHLPYNNGFGIDAEFSAGIHSSVAEIERLVHPLQRQAEEREEKIIINRLFDAAPEKVTLGVQETLDALNEKRVELLLVHDRFRVKGGFSLPSHFLTLGDSGIHPINGEPVEAAEDVVDLAIQSAIDQGASIEIVCSEAGKALLDGRNIQLAAFLRY